MRARTAFALGIMALDGIITVDNAIDSLYESGIKFFGKHPGLRNNPVGKAVESALIDGYLNRNMPREPEYTQLSRSVPTVMMIDDQPLYGDGFNRRMAQAPPLDKL